MPEEVKDLLGKEQLTERHARALLKLVSAEQQIAMISEIVRDNLTVSDTEKKITRLIEKDKQKKGAPKRKGMVRDVRIFLNTIRQAVKIIEKSGLDPRVEEKVEKEYVEVTIRFQRKGVSSGAEKR